MNNILASAIKDIPHFAAFDRLAAHRFEEIDLGLLMVYLIDTVEASAIPFLAEQFDVQGYKGMMLAKNQAQQRELIKRAIELKRFSGTVWGVQEALKSIGYPDAIIQENAGSSPSGWAEFRIQLDGGLNEISAEKLEELIKMIEVYKGARNHLIDLSYKIDLGADSLTLHETAQENPSIDELDQILAGGNFLHDGTFLRNGLKNYSTDSDILEIKMIT